MPLTLTQPSGDFIDYAKGEQGLTKQTTYTYRSWLNAFLRWLDANGHADALDSLMTPVLRTYVYSLTKRGLRPRTVRSAFLPARGRLQASDLERLLRSTDEERGPVSAALCVRQDPLPHPRRGGAAGDHRQQQATKKTRGRSVNAVFVKSTTATGQANAGNITDATLANDPTQYDGTLHSGVPDRTRYVIWDLGSPQMMSGWPVGYNGGMSGAYVDFSSDGSSWVSQYGPTGGNGTTYAPVDFLPDGGIGPYRYVRFRPNSPSGDWAIDETRVSVDPGGVVGGPVTASPKAVTGLYNFIGQRTLISAVSFTVA